MRECNEQHLESIDWAVIMRDHYTPACRAIKRLMPGALRAGYDPEDFVADALVELMARPERLAEQGSTFLVLIAKRRMIDAVRSPRGRLTRLEVDVIDDQPPAILEHEAAELRQMMLDRAGDPTTRNVVDLRSRGHTLPEIAELTGLGLRTLQRCFKRFTEANEPY